MDQTFNVEAFISRIGKRLVGQFDDARAATSPATVGAAMEQPVRAQMEQILPRGIEVGIRIRNRQPRRNQSSDRPGSF